MSHGPRPAESLPPPSLVPSEGWHCSHLYYRWNRGVLARLSPHDLSQGREELLATLDPEGPLAPKRLQTSAVHHRLMAGRLGPALEPTYSFVSVTEISEYVPSVEQYGQKLIAEGDAEGSPAYQAKLKAYADRLPAMNRQRLTPEFPPNYQATCFYPMNKKRKVGENWFTLSFAERNRMMAEHARSGMEFAGKVSQLITVGVGLEDWEWGVTLWARNPEYLTEIVYRMRFDEASARFGEFGPFYTSYVVTPAAMLQHCRVG
jgi:chlorite dismutase